MPSAQNICPRCQKPLAPDAPMGLCPECLVKAGFPTGNEAATAESSGGRPRFVPPPIAEIARLFPQLDILELLGQGGMGAVYKARQRELDRIVALKILPPAIGQDPSFAERFSREAKALAKLNHPGIVQLYEFGRADGLFYFLMEFVDGASLRQLLNAGRISPREALAVVPQICDALQYAHDQGIVHRDIKPENILLDRRGRVKVADFGVAKLVGAATEPQAGTTPVSPTLTAAGKVIGTPQYMAPEQLEHPGEVDHRADIYALGVVFYQMLTGELPVGKFAPPSQKVQIDVRLDEVLLQALQKEPQRRYQHISEIKTAVEAIASAPGSQSQEQAFSSQSLRLRDRWLWDAKFTWLYLVVPAVVAAILALALHRVLGSRTYFVMVLVPAGLLLALNYSLVGMQVRRLKKLVPADALEVAEALFYRRPLQRPGLAVLCGDRLELIPIIGSSFTVPLKDIRSVRETKWFLGGGRKRLLWKVGLLLEVADAPTVMLAVPEPNGRRWKPVLESKGSMLKSSEKNRTQS